MKNIVGRQDSLSANMKAAFQQLNTKIPQAKGRCGLAIV